jgi:hypothetical protein
MGSPGFAVGTNRALAHQEELNEFSSFFAQICYESPLAHGFVMR